MVNTAAHRAKVQARQSKSIATAGIPSVREISSALNGKLSLMLRDDDCEVFGHGRIQRAQFLLLLLRLARVAEN